VSDHVGARQSDEAWLSPLQQFSDSSPKSPATQGALRHEAAASTTVRDPLQPAHTKIRLTVRELVAWGSFRCTSAAVVAVKPKRYLGAALWL
jgi:hypothetical protein